MACRIRWASSRCSRACPGASSGAASARSGPGPSSLAASIGSARRTLRARIALQSRRSLWPSGSGRAKRQVELVPAEAILVPPDMNAGFIFSSGAKAYVDAVRGKSGE